MCCNFCCDSFIAGLAEARENRQNYLRATARCSHSQGDLQASLPVHASQWWSLLGWARGAHTEVLRSRGKTSWTWCTNGVYFVNSNTPWDFLECWWELWKGIFQIFLCFCNLGLFYFNVPVERMVPGEGSLSGWAFIQLQVASLRTCCQEWTEVETSSPREFPHISRNLLSVGLWLRASGGERRDGVRKHCRGIAKESLWSLYFPIACNQDLTAAFIVIARCY